jgi:hypothetical protein
MNINILFQVGIIMNVSKSFLLLSVTLGLSQASFAGEHMEVPVTQDFQFSQGEVGVPSEVAQENLLKQEEQVQPMVIPEGHSMMSEMPASAFDGQQMMHTESAQPMDNPQVQMMNEEQVQSMGMPGTQAELVNQQMMSEMPLIANHQLEESHNPAVIPSVVDNPVALEVAPPSLTAQEKVAEAMEELKEKKLEEAQQEALLNNDVVSEESLVAAPAKKKKAGKKKLTAEEIQALKAAGAEKTLARTAARKEAEDAKKLEQKINAEQVEENMTAAPLLTEESLAAAPAKKKKAGKKKLTAEEIGALKAAGAEKTLARTAARKEAEDAKKLEEKIELEHLAEEVQHHEDGSAVAISGSAHTQNPFAVLFFTPEEAVDLQRTINEGAAFNNKKMDSVVIVVDPAKGENDDIAAKEEKQEPAIVVGTPAGPEVNFEAEVSKNGDAVASKEGMDQKDPASVAEIPGEHQQEIAAQ